MFAVIYRGYVKPGKEAEYKKLWHKIANYFMEKRGAIGSCLHKTDDNMWVAYSRWPDKATRDASWASEDNSISSEMPDDIRNSIKSIKDCLDSERQLPEISMEVVDDLF